LTGSDRAHSMKFRNTRQESSGIWAYYIRTCLENTQEYTGTDRRCLHGFIAGI